MRQFTPKPGTQSAIRILETPFADITTFSAAVQELVMANPLGCTSYFMARKHLPPVMKVRERYTAKFVYENGRKKQIGSTSEVYDSVDGYLDGIHAVMSNMANTAAHRGRPRHVAESDRFSVIMKCHEAGGELYFIGMARDRITVASYTDDAILWKAKRWIEKSPVLGDTIYGGKGTQHR